MSRLLQCVFLGLVATSVQASDPLQQARQARDWASGTAACEQLASIEARRPDRRQLAAAQYAEKAANCAAIASGAGDQRSAVWWWFTAVSMDARHAVSLLPQFRSAGLLTEIPPPRTALLTAAKKLEKGEVLLPNGEIVAGESIEVTTRPDPPKHMFRPISAVARTEVIVEILVDGEGYPTQPVLVSAKALPLHALLAFDYLRQWRFTPARVNGEPVTSAYRVTVSTSGQEPFRGSA